MSLNALDRLRHAVIATTHGGGQATIAAKLRRSGLDAFEPIRTALSSEQADAVERTADRLHAQGLDAVLLGQEGYPDTLRATRSAPAALFLNGARDLLARAALGMCGSRNATEEGLRAARACGEAGTVRGYTVVSGYARGVDLAAHTGALASGGSTTIVLAEGIERFRVRRGEFAELWNPSRALVVSQFAPGQAWSAGAAMTRNAVISGLSKALVVVEAGETGGTLAAGLHALDRGQPVLVLQLFGAPAGNRLLQERGATPVSSRQELETLLDDLPSNGSLQLSLM